MPAARPRTLKIMAALSLAFAASPAHPQASEAAVKATFLPKFARYVDWPAGARPGPGQSYRLCIIGQDPFGQLIDRAAAREIVNGRPVTVHRVTTTRFTQGCHLALVSGTAAQSTSEILAALRNRPVLTVTDAREGPQRGMIHFTIADGRVRFYIDEAAAARHGLSISSRLLALAIGVRQRG